MFEDNSSVPSTEGTDGSLSNASVENNANPEVTASNAESNAAITTPQSEPPIESVGIQQLRTQYNALKNDLSLYKPAHEFIEQNGGLERAQEVMPTALGLYSEMIKPGNEFDGFKIAETFYQQAPDNFHTFAMGLVSQYRPLQEMIDQKIREGIASQSGQSQNYRQDNNLELDESDPYHAEIINLKREIESLRQENGQIKGFQDQERTKSQEAVAAQNFETYAGSYIKNAIQEPLAQLKGWSEDDIQSVNLRAKQAINNNPTLMAKLEELETISRTDKPALGRIYDLRREAKKEINIHMKEAIEYYSKRFAIQNQTIQQQRATQQARREPNTSGASVPATPQAFNRPNDPALKDALLAEMAQMRARSR